VDEFSTEGYDGGGVSSCVVDPLVVLSFRLSDS